MFPLFTGCAPPTNRPAESKVPAVLIRVATAPVPNTRNAPCIVPALVIVKLTAELVEIVPVAAVPKLGAIRAAKVGAFVEPASVHKL